MQIAINIIVIPSRIIITIDVISIGTFAIKPNLAVLVWQFAIAYTLAGPYYKKPFYLCRNVYKHSSENISV